MTDPNVSEWVQVKTIDGSAQMRADHDALHLADLSWSYMTPAQWREFAEKGNAIAAGIQGRKVLAIADGTMALFDLAADVEACLPAFPGLDALTDADWANVDRVLRALPGSWPLLRELWDLAAQSLEAA